MVWAMTAVESLYRPPPPGAEPGWWGRVGAEVSRRLDLARQPQPSGVRGPPLRRLLGELGAPRLFVTLPAYRASRPQAVMLLPGFAAHPLRMRRMGRALAQAGHQPHDWGLGFNLGPTPDNFAMGTPFSGDRRANNAWRAYQLVTGHAVDCPPIECDFAAKPPVPTVALWSPRDGVVAPRSARGRPGERDRAVALRCSHLGFVGDPGCIGEVLRQLDFEA
jgi:hypothetical protein